MKGMPSLFAIVFVLVVALGAATAKWVFTGQTESNETENFRARTELKVAQTSAQGNAAPVRAAEPVRSSSAVGQGKEASTNVEAAEEIIDAMPLDSAKVRPLVTTNATGRKMYFFTELYGASNQIVARDAQFRELLGYTKMAFRTSEGVRYYDLDDLHPEVIRSLGYDSTVLKRALAAEFQQRQILGAQAQFQADLRIKAAAELAEREKAAAERTKAEAAIREAEARERLAAVAERAATNPPRERITQKYLFVSPYSKIITNGVTFPPVQPPSFPSIQPVPQ